jgi:hypothetical protein
VATLDSLVGAGGFAPCFPTRDLRSALAHYQQLGFQVMPYTAGATWAWARLGRALEATGVAGTSEPYDTEYGREVVHIDPDNNLTRFATPA